MSSFPFLVEERGAANVQLLQQWLGKHGKASTKLHEMSRTIKMRDKS